jgi:HK97 family phage major capsid protein
MNHTLEMKQLADQSQALMAKAVAEGRDMTPEEQATVSGNLDKAESLKRSLDLQQRAQATFGSSGPAQVRENILDKPFKNLGEQLRAIKSAALNPAKVDIRLHELNERAASGASEGVPSDGGFLVAPAFQSEILKLAHETGNVYKRGRQIPLDANTNAIKIPAVDESSRVDGSRWGGVQMYWADEAGALTASRPKFRQIEMSLKKLVGLFYATDELLADSSAVGSLVSQAFGEEVGFKLDDAAVNGDGVGKPLGILQSGALITISEESSQAATTFNWENAKKMWGRLWVRSRANAVWFVNQDVEQALLGMVQLAGTGGGSSVVNGIVGQQGPAAYTAPGVNGNATGLLMGRPVIPIEQCASLGTVGDVILADMSQWLYIDKGQVEGASSMHVKFLTDEMTFRWIYRVDGQPSWHKALTPFKGSNTVSPFVTIETR